MLKIDATCVSCNEVIYNPICPECLSVEIEEWLREKRGLFGLKREILKTMKGLTTAGNNIQGLKCVTCNHPSVFLCPYCFTEEVYLKLKQRKASKEFLQDFLETFNFDFNHQGYSKDLYKGYEDVRP